MLVCSFIAEGRSKLYLHPFSAGEETVYRDFPHTCEATDIQRSIATSYDSELYVTAQ